MGWDRMRWGQTLFANVVFFASSPCGDVSLLSPSPASPSAGADVILVLVSPEGASTCTYSAQTRIVGHTFEQRKSGFESWEAYEG